MDVSQHRDNPTAAPADASVTLGGLPQGYQRLHSNFRWAVPEYFNIAQVCCARWATQKNATKRVAVHAYSTRAESTFYGSLLFRVERDG